MVVARIAEDGFAELRMSLEEAGGLVGLMKSRIRRLSHLDRAGPSEFAEISRLARICYGLSPAAGAEPASAVVLPHMSREDLDSIYVLDLTEAALNALNNVRFAARRGGPVDPVAADRAAKSIVSVMED